jgi:hypothetical protein
MTIKARPLLFSRPMVHGLLEDRKTHTRRTVKHAALDCLDNCGFTPADIADQANGLCPYGYAGDLLWVRETGLPAYKATPADCGWVYLADYGYQVGLISEQEARGSWTWRPSIHMPRMASRLTLELEEVRIERLQDISEDDAKAEGIKLDKGVGWFQIPGTHDYVSTAKKAYELLWSRINGPESWAANPWVWVLVFKVHHANVDTVIKGTADLIRAKADALEEFAKL